MINFFTFDQFCQIILLIFWFNFLSTFIDESSRAGLEQILDSVSKCRLISEFLPNLKKGIDPSSVALANIGLMALLEMKPGFELFDSLDLGSGEL